MDLSVAPAWFQTSWFLLLCVAAGTILVAEIYRFRVGQVAASMNARFDERVAERTRIAQELHDTLLQGFLSASMQVHIAQDFLPEDSQAKPILTRALQLMGQVIDEGRNAVRGLRLSHCISLDLEQAFARIEQEIELPGSNGKKVAYRVISTGRRRELHPLLQDEIHRIGREAVTNAFRHARANHIDVELTYGSSQFRLLIRDDGRGIESDVLQTGRAGHFGLSGMRERADRIGARFQVFTRASVGTEVELTISARIAYQDQPKSWFGWFGQKELVATDERR
jgi:signal transduction histidine kinase